jgi:hypothetical protein
MVGILGNATVSWITRRRGPSRISSLTAGMRIDAAAAIRVVTDGNHDYQHDDDGEEDEASARQPNQNHQQLLLRTVVVSYPRRLMLTRDQPGGRSPTDAGTLFGPPVLD